MELIIHKLRKRLSLGPPGCVNPSMEKTEYL